MPNVDVPLKQKPKGKADLPAPPATSDSHAVGNNTEQSDDDKLVPFNHQVPKWFKRKVDVFLAEHGLQRVKLIKQLLTDYMEEKGSANQ